MNKIKSLQVFYNEKKVGTLALMKNNIVAFEYDNEWINNGFSISPFSLPLKKQVFIPKIDPFDGLYGVFSDSLPDGWGRLLVDRMLNSQNINPREISQIDRLAIVGETGMGALSYKPEYNLLEDKDYQEDYDNLALSCKKILNTEHSADLDNLFRLGGSSGGARPKILTKIDNEDWIIKFPSSLDDNNIGELEYLYSVCAKKCKIDIPETKLFPSKISSGYFGIKRFDRKKLSTGTIRKLHMISVSGLLETSHRIPNLDYNDLMQLTLNLTKSFEEVEKLFRLMCFNVFSHNRDDHSKNFSFIYNEDLNKWELSPAYDLTYSYSINGEHATTINGNGVNPSLNDILKVAEKIGLDKKKAEKIAIEIRETVRKDLEIFLSK
ncbi:MULTISPECIES: type II toxin-antitoxin system HipA family toxin [Fusobacterium]|mgnify:FL=1|jgi:hipA protein|uniref:type II toxin-antitoxin system HipA family toxin n=1 Tax=Fusobacterium TaxID=848 RepID=UPI001CADCD39|nr:type II toxin-antitoxin system HipA family toxin [Fusobacterium pseudoperiodonticum]MBF1195756.1 type II toxin-antitoxin system HipA family toxin [Fusobacterium periodonticum]MDU5803884.1 type II toxin-antitoxin system HipA family toxin [Fusobacterium periodonticum]